MFFILFSTKRQTTIATKFENNKEEVHSIEMSMYGLLYDYKYNIKEMFCAVDVGKSINLLPCTPFIFFCSLSLFCCSSIDSYQVSFDLSSTHKNEIGKQTLCVLLLYWCLARMEKHTNVLTILLLFFFLF